MVEARTIKRSIKSSIRFPRSRSSIFTSVAGILLPERRMSCPLRRHSEEVALNRQPPAARDQWTVRKRADAGIGWIRLPPPKMREEFERFICIRSLLVISPDPKARLPYSDSGADPNKRGFTQKPTGDLLQT